MLMGEKLFLYLDKVGEIEKELCSLRNSSIKDFDKYFENGDNGHCLELPPELAKNFTVMYSYVMVKNKLLQKASDLLNIFKLDPTYEESNRNDLLEMLNSIQTKINFDNDFIKSFKDFINIKGKVTCIISDGDGNVVEEITVDVAES